MLTPSAHSRGSFFDSISLMGATMPYGRDAEIYGENEPADYVYRVISGAVRTYKVLGDGRRQIGASTCPVTSLGSKRAMSIRFRLKRSATRKFSSSSEVPCWHWQSARARRLANCGR